MATIGILGYVLCTRCDEPVLKEIAYKTGGLCGEHFRQDANAVIDAAMVVVDGRERIVLRSKRSPAELARRARARKRAKAKPDPDRSTGAHCSDRARRRLARIFPELFEVLLADERAKAGLSAWTIDRALTPGEASSTMDFVKTYHALEEA